MNTNMARFIVLMREFESIALTLTIEGKVGYLLTSLPPAYDGIFIIYKQITIDRTEKWQEIDWNNVRIAILEGERIKEVH